jgi:nicotinamide-nucleotide amidase
MIELSKKILKLAKAKNIIIAVAESCTGGMVSSSITSIPGSSDVFDRGFVTYSYESKTDLLGVPAALINKQGAVSKEVAELMVIGTLKNSNANLAVAITGIAGPSGGTETKTVGLVHFASNYKGKVFHQQKIFDGNRDAIRQSATQHALEMLLERIENS